MLFLFVLALEEKKTDDIMERAKANHRKKSLHLSIAFYYFKF